jgi:tetratricopeptide (TPR) repeat protein
VNLSIVLLWGRDAGLGESALQEALTLLEPLIAEPEADARAIDFYARAQSNLSTRLSLTGRSGEAQAALRKAIESSQRLVTVYPAEPEYRAAKAMTHSSLATLLAGQNPGEAIAEYRKSVALYDGLWADFPEQIRYRRYQWAAQRSIAELYLAQGDVPKAAEEFGVILRVFETHVKEAPGRSEFRNELAWLLANCPIKDLRNPARAVQLARRTTEQAPELAHYWDTLGSALYRAGDLPGAEEALTRAIKLSHNTIPESMLFLAMVRCRLGDPAAAGPLLLRSDDWLNYCQRDNLELHRFRDEADQLLLQAKEPTKRPGAL